jgi:catechol 2,3-dioxygenase-like lactoylglutathione lyase family enzyme
MEKEITNLVKSFEKGGLTRRDLIRGLTMLAAGTATATASTAAQSPEPIPWLPLCDHLQINTADPQRGAEFYQEVMGLKLLRQGPPNDRDCCPEDSAFLGVGDRLVLALRNNEPYGVIDHWSMMAPGYTPDRFRAAIEERGGEIAQHGLGGQYVRDPDGVLCQLMGNFGPA